MFWVQWGGVSNPREFIVQDELLTSSPARLSEDPEDNPPDHGRGSKLSDYGFLLIVSGAVIALDQWTKALVRSSLAPGQIWTPYDGFSFVRIVHWHNTGAAFGLFQNLGGVFSVLAVFVAVAILYYFPQVPRRDWPLRLVMGLQLGGAVGNLIDRLTLGWVTDFVSVGDFPVFNVADASISIGVVVLVLSLWVSDRGEADPESTGEEGVGHLEENGEDRVDGSRGVEISDRDRDLDLFRSRRSFYGED
jgi:signal peptidase II